MRWRLPHSSAALGLPEMCARPHGVACALLVSVIGRDWLGAITRDSVVGSHGHDTRGESPSTSGGRLILRAGAPYFALLSAEEASAPRRSAEATAWLALVSSLKA